MSFKTDKSIHLETEQYRILGLAETAALEGDSTKAYTLIAVADAVSRLRADGNGIFRTKQEDN